LSAGLGAVLAVLAVDDFAGALAATLLAATFSAVLAGVLVTGSSFP